MKHELFKKRKYLIIFSLFISLSMSAQNTITGKVTSAADNMGIPGVSIAVKGTNTGAISDFNGEYTIKTTKGAILVFSSIGFTTKEIAVGGKSLINVTLDESLESLEQVVVTGYGTVKRNEFVGSTSVIKATEINKAPLTSIEEGLKGQLAGVQITQSSGQPGAGISVRIRGVSSFAGGSEPLFVIDGVPQFNDDVNEHNGLSTLNPDDIESIEVLKDASSTAIYGSRASNGVVQIVTKNGGKGDKTEISYGTYFASQTIDNPYEVMTGDEFIAYATEFITNGTLLNDDQKAAQLAELSSVGNANTDWQSTITRPGTILGHNLSFSGGNKENNYYISANFQENKGVIKETDFRRISVRSNLRNKLNKVMNLRTNIYLAQARTNGFLPSKGTNTRNLQKSGIGSTLLAFPTVPVYDENGNFSNVSPYSFGTTDLENPVGFTQALDRNTSKSANVAFTLSTKILKHFSNTTRTSGGFSQRKIDFYSPSFLPQLGSQVARLRTIEGQNLLLESFFNYKNTFAKKFEVDAIVGGSINERRSNQIILEGVGFPDDVLENNAIQSASVLSVPLTISSKQRLVSAFSRVRINYDKKYLLTLNARRDGASVFSANNKWADFGAIGFAWRVDKENFMKNTPFNQLKLRASKGSTGSQAIRPYQSLLLGQNALTGQTAGSGVAVGLAPNLPNPNLTWETTVQTNFGLDAGLYNNKYRFSFDIYNKETKDLLAVVRLPQSSGFSRITDNIGRIRNYGYEIQLGLDIVNTDDWLFSIDGQISVNKNEVLETKDGEDILSTVNGNDTSRVTTIVREGESLFSLFGAKYLGNDEDGRPLYEDFNEDGVSNSGDNQIIGNTLPDFSYGFRTRLSYKNFSLDTNWQGVQGNKVQNTTLRTLALPGIEGNKLKNAKDFFPAIDDLFILASDRFVQDGSYLRLANVRLNYNVDTKNIKFLNSLNIYLSAQNVFTITDYIGFNPEVNSFSGNDSRQGVDLGGYPSARTVTFGFNVKF